MTFFDSAALARGEYLRTHFKNMREVAAALTGRYSFVVEGRKMIAKWNISQASNSQRRTPTSAMLKSTSKLFPSDGSLVVLDVRVRQSSSRQHRVRRNFI